jgi:hypothetical protein
MSDAQSRRRILIGVLVAVAVAVVVVFAISPGNDNPKKPAATLTVPVDGLDAGKAPDRSVKVPVAAVKQAAPTIEDQLNVPPAATPDAQLQAAQEAADRVRRTQAPLPTAGATAGFQGCRTSFVRNQSSRRGVRPQWQVLHLTVSPNRPGWSDVNAIVALFDRTSSQASSNFVIDSEGHCAYVVPIEAKAWTQAAANPFSVSYEIVNTGGEAVYLGKAGMAKLRSVVHEVARRTGIPLRRGSTNNCAPGRSGLVQHKDFGICGGGHVDILKFNANTIIGQLVGSGQAPLTAAQAKACGTLQFHRRRAHELGAWSPARAARAGVLKARIPAGRCVSRFR